VYTKIQKEIDEILKRERLVIMGDFNAKIGSNKVHVACGKFGLGETNERGEMLPDWMENNNLIKAKNTCFRHRLKESHVGIARWQIYEHDRLYHN